VIGGFRTALPGSVVKVSEVDLESTSDQRASFRDWYRRKSTEEPVAPAVAIPAQQELGLLNSDV